MSNVITSSINKSKSDPLMDGQCSVMSWKYEPSIINNVAFCIYFLWTFELIMLVFATVV